MCLTAPGVMCVPLTAGDTELSFTESVVLHRPAPSVLCTE